MQDAAVGPLTTKGRQTRARIVGAAADLMTDRGVASVSLDEVGRATSTSKSQMYHYFSSKDDLIAAVVDRVGEDILGFQEQLLEGMESIEDVERWADAIVVHQRGAGCFKGCPLGTLASELAVESALDQLGFDQLFASWTSLLEEGLRRMQASGRLRPDADPRRLAVATLASLQGGLLMAKATQDESTLRIPLDAAIEHLRTYLAD